MYCDSDSNNFEADEKQKPKKKKKPKNLPFEGHGIGYHQGKTVIIKLPTSESIKLPDVSTIDSFNYFSNAPQTMSPEAAVSSYGQEVAYPYHTPKPMSMTELIMQGGEDKLQGDPITGLNMDTPEQSDEIMSIDEMSKEIAKWGSPTGKDNSDKQEESSAEAYERLAKTIKQKVYSESLEDYGFKVNKDYTQFFNPAEYKGSDTIKDLEERFGKFNNVPPHIQDRIPIRMTQDRYQNQGDGRTIDLRKSHNEFVDTDSTYRTSLPMSKPYSAYEQTETPKYATGQYLKDRENFSGLYSPKNLALKQHGTQNVKYSPLSYTDYVMEHKSNEASRRPSSGEYDDTRESPKKSSEYNSGNYYDEDTTESPNSSEEYDDTEPPQKSLSYSLFGSPVPLTNNWYKPVYNLEQVPHSYAEDISASQEDR